MKPFLILTVILLAGSPVFSQDVPADTQAVSPDSDIILAKFKARAIEVNKSYKCSGKDAKLVSWTGFDTIFRPILSNVFVGNGDLATNTTAAALTQDAEKGTLNINYSIFNNENRNALWNIGVFSKSTDGVFGIYSADSWNAEVGFNIGYSIVLGKGAYFDEDKCEELKRKRQGHIRNLLNKYEDLLTKDRNKLQQEIDKRIKAQENAVAKESSEDFEKIEKELKDLDSVKKAIERLIPPAGSEDSDVFYDTTLEADIVPYEKRNADVTGHWVAWLQPHFSIANNKISVKTDSLAVADKSTFKARNTAKFIFGINLQGQQETKRTLKYGSFGVDVGLRNYLDHPFVKDPFLRKDSVTQQMLVYNKTGELLNNYDLVRSNIWTIEPSLYFSLFFIAEKSIGFDVALSTRILASKTDAIENSDYRDTYKIAIGPTFRIKKDESVSKGTVGLEVGIIDAPTKENAWDFFGARLKVGLPFNALIK